ARGNATGIGLVVPIGARELTLHIFHQCIDFRLRGPWDSGRRHFAGPYFPHNNFPALAALGEGASFLTISDIQAAGGKLVVVAPRTGILKDAGDVPLKSGFRGSSILRGWLTVSSRHKGCGKGGHRPPYSRHHPTFSLRQAVSNFTASGPSPD